MSSILIVASERMSGPIDGFGDARFCWAATLWITSYWAHPGALATFPTSEVAWIGASPSPRRLIRTYELR